MRASSGQTLPRNVMFQSQNSFSSPNLSLKTRTLKGLVILTRSVALFSERTHSRCTTGFRSLECYMELLQWDSPHSAGGLRGISMLVQAHGSEAWRVLFCSWVSITFSLWFSSGTLAWCFPCGNFCFICL